MMSAKFNFIRHPGYIYGINGEFWVDPDSMYFLYKTDTQIGNLRDVLGNGYVISKKPYLCYNILDTQILLRPYFYSLHTTDTTIYSTEGRWIDYSKQYFIHDLELVVSFYDVCNPLGTNWYSGLYLADRPLSSLKFGETLVYKKIDTSDSNDEPDTITVRIDFPCWFSPTFFGEYQPFGGASDTITIGTPILQDDGTEVLSYREYGKLVYMGSIPVWK